MVLSDPDLHLYVAGVDILLHCNATVCTMALPQNVKTPSCNAARRNL